MGISVARNDAAIIDPQFEIVVGIFHNAAHIFIAVVAQWQRHFIIIIVSERIHSSKQIFIPARIE